METIIGLLMIYVWAHSGIVIFSKTKDLTQYETAVLIVGFITFLLYVLGTAGN